MIKTRALQNAILNSVNFSIIATDPQGVIQLFNVGAERMLGYTAAQLIDKVNPSDLHDPGEVLARAQALSAEFGVPIAPGFEALAFKASRGIEDIYELTYICSDGKRFPAIVSITALSDDFGEIIGYLLIGSHNSVRQRVELELAEAMAVADQANLAKSEFLSSMSHELRTPLNAILGFAQLIETGLPAPTPLQQRSVAQILKAGWYLLDLINEILDLTMIESGKMSLSLEPIPLAEVLRESKAMIEPQASKRGIQVSFPPLAALSVVTADRTRLKQVLINLLSNAIKYNREGGSVMVQCAPASAGRIRISITDTGLGLSADNLRQLFQPFNRLGQEAHVGEGTGIGLVMSKRLVELMGGVIGVDSTVGVGSVFWIELKSSEAPRRTVVEAGTEIAALGPRDAGAQLRTLLYVEDNPDNLMLVEDLMLRRPDIRLMIARDGASGVAMARSSLPDVILMDINLPGMSGIEALRVLSVDHATAAYPDHRVERERRSPGYRSRAGNRLLRYLTKPIKIVEFLETVDQAFARGAAAAAVA